jgi:hypothetical protein
MKNKLLTLFAAIGVIITLLPFPLEAGSLGQWCSNENILSDYRYRCGSFWQVIDCQSYYDTIYQQCLYKNKYCCNPSKKSSENPYDVELTEMVGPDVVKAFTEIENGLPRDNVRKSKPFKNDGRNGTKKYQRRTKTANPLAILNTP